MNTHTHTHHCDRCGYAWACDKEKCQLAPAAKAMQSGPFCHVCYHIIMMKRFATARNLTAKQLIDQLHIEKDE